MLYSVDTYRRKNRKGYRSVGHFAQHDRLCFSFVFAIEEGEYPGVSKLFKTIKSIVKPWILPHMKTKGSGFDIVLQSQYPQEIPMSIYQRQRQLNCSILERANLGSLAKKMLLLMAVGKQSFIEQPSFR